MKKECLGFVLAFAFLSIYLTGFVGAVSVVSDITPDINTEDFAPLIWLCKTRTLLDDATEPGRISGDGRILRERVNNYAFEGEQLSFWLLVMDKNGIDKINDVHVTIGDNQGEGNQWEANCYNNGFTPVSIWPSCNARILEEQITEFDRETMAFYDCIFTVETPESMYGEYWVTAEVEDLDGNLGTIDENEYWFLNPVIALSVLGDLSFDNVRPGTSSYSSTILVGNDADAGSGVLLDMFISGTDFYDSSSSGAKCPDTNQLSLDAFRYFATNGAYSSAGDDEVDPVDGDRDRDSEGYVNIEYGIGFNNPSPFYNNAEILQDAAVGGYYAANVVAPGAEMALTFRLDLPEPCNGDFDSGSIYFWGEAI